MIHPNPSLLRRHFIAANVPAYLYRMLTSEPTIVFLSNSVTPQELFDELEKALGSTEPADDVIIEGYAYLAALLLRPEVEAFHLEGIAFPPAFAWMPEMIAMHRSRRSQATTNFTRLQADPHATVSTTPAATTPRPPGLILPPTYGKRTD